MNGLPGILPAYAAFAMIIQRVCLQDKDGMLPNKTVVPEMKTISACALLLTLASVSCAHIERQHLTRQLGALGSDATREDLYKVAMPIVEPDIGFWVLNSSGIRGSETYPVSADLEVAYSVFYTDSPSYDTIITADLSRAIMRNESGSFAFRQLPTDTVSNFRVRLRKQNKMMATPGKPSDQFGG
jgi:hypothetical protein